MPRRKGGRHRIILRKDLESNERTLKQIINGWLYDYKIDVYGDAVDNLILRLEK